MMFKFFRILFNRFLNIKSFISVLILFTLVLVNPKAAWSSTSSALCVDLFLKDTSTNLNALPSVLELLNRTQLKESFFKVDENNFLLDTAHGNQVIGELIVINPPYFYEWADKDYHDIWVSNGGISAKDMRDILKEPPQAVGRGYYVSKNPLDSESFGSTLTVFKPKGPFVAIRENQVIKMSSTEFMLRLQKAGIDAVQMAKDSWLSVITSKHLKVVDGIIEDPFWSDPNVLGSLSYVINKFDDKFLAQLPKGSLLNTLLKLKSGKISDISDDEIQTLINSLKINPYLTSHYNSPKVASSLAKYNLKKFSQVNENNPDDLIAATNLFLSGTSFREIFKSTFKASLSKTQKLYLMIPEFFDIKTLVRLAQGKKIKNINSFDDIKKESIFLAKQMKQIKLHSINNFDDFLLAGQAILGKTPKFRSFDVTLDSELKETTSQAIQSQKNVIDGLRRNGLLTVTDEQQIENSQQSSAVVSFFSFKKLIENVEMLPLTSRLKNELKNFKTTADNTNSNQKVARLYEKALRELTVALFSDLESQKQILKLAYPQKFYTNSIAPTALDLYNAFISLHPFEEGNRRIGNIFYDLMSINNPAAQRLNYPLFALDLLGNEIINRQMTLYSEFFNLYLSKAQNDQDFLRRCQLMLVALLKMKPELLQTFPELQEIK